MTVQFSCNDVNGCLSMAEAMISDPFVGVTDVQFLNIHKFADRI